MSSTAESHYEVTPPASVAAAGEPWCVRPSDVLNDPALNDAQKRSILASWLSDRHAIPDAPRWRQLDNGAFVDSYEVRDALYRLDGADPDEGRGGDPASSGRERRRRWRRGRIIRPIIRRRRDDDDDPPPCPAGLPFPPPHPLDIGSAATPEIAVAAYPILYECQSATPERPPKSATQRRAAS